MVAPSVMPGRAFQRVDRISRLLFHWTARDLSLVPRTGQIPTFSRASDGSAIDSGGRVRNLVHSMPRFEYVDLDGDGIRETPGILLEGSRTNTLVQSQALATTWVPTDLTPTNNSAIAPDGTVTATALVPTAVNSNQHKVVQAALAITANENLAFSFKVKANGYPAVVCYIVDTATATNGFLLSFDATTGLFGTTLAQGTGTLVGTAKATLINGYWHISGSGTIGGGVTSAQVIIKVFDTIAHANANTAFLGDGVSGVLGWGAQLERGSAFPSSYIKTVGAPVTRAADSFTLPFAFGPRDLTVLAQLARPAHADVAGSIGLFPGIFSLSSNATPRCEGYFDQSSRIETAVIKTPGQVTAQQNIPAGAAITHCATYRNLRTGGIASVDVGAGVSADSAAAAAFSAFGNQTLAVGASTGGSDCLFGVLASLKIAAGLYSLSQMLGMA